MGLLNQIDIHNLYVAISIFLVIVSVPSDPAPGANVFTTTLPSAYTAGGVPASSGSVRISSPIPIQTAAWWHGQGVGIGMGGSWPSMAILVPLQGFDQRSNFEIGISASNPKQNRSHHGWQEIPAPGAPDLHQLHDAKLRR